MTIRTASFATDATLALPRLGGDAAPAAVLERLRTDGVVIVENALSPEVVAQVNSEIEPWFERAYAGEGQFFGRSTKRFSGLFAKAPSAATLALQPLVLSVMESVLKGEGETPHCDAIELNLTQAIGIGPGEPPQFLHRDEELWPYHHPFEIMANAMWTLDAFTAENGATRLIPGSHRWPRDRQPQPGEALPAIAPAGSVILWLGGTLHGGGANGTDVIRRGIVMSYRLGWLAPSEKLLLSTPPEVARALPQRLQQLIGYQLHRPNLGWVEGRDPIEWLRGDVKELASAGDNLTEQHQLLLADLAKAPERYLGYLT